MLVARKTTAQADENLRVARDRYQHQAGTNTEVLDAETLRVQAYTNLYNSTYQAALAALGCDARSAICERRFPIFGSDHPLKTASRLATSSGGNVVRKTFPPKPRNAGAAISSPAESIQARRPNRPGQFRQ